jgi:hypothetical protein
MLTGQPALLTVQIVVRIVGAYDLVGHWYYSF